VIGFLFKKELSQSFAGTTLFFGSNAVKQARFESFEAAAIGATF
jgi:hypothetical protein